MEDNKTPVGEHFKWNGKIEVVSRVRLDTKDDLSLAYTPGVAQPCLEIQKEPDLSFALTRRGNLVAVITDGTAVLGLGDIGPAAAMPVMEGKCALFKEFGGVDAFPLCIRSKDVDEIVHTVELLSDNFGGINLEDISAPRCFEIERKLKEKLDIPVFHDDQHGTAIVVGAALINALKLAGKQLMNITVVINGAGAAGIAIAKFLLRLGAGDVILCDRFGAVYRGHDKNNQSQEEIAQLTNRKMKKGSLAEILIGADVFIGVSRPGLVTADMIRHMAERPIVFAMANPTPEIMPEEALAAGAFVMGTGRSDYPNQINNLLAFPGVFKGAISVRASDINEEMKCAAAYGIASLVKEDELSTDYILPSPLDKRVAERVASSVAEAARTSGVAKR